jgi:hypothetical protein
MRTEIETRDVPYEQIEITFARNRPVSERTPIPEPGDSVFYRREYWDQLPVLATVLKVQSLDDRDDPNLWQLVRDSWGKPILDEGGTRYSRLPDPWPWVMLSLPSGGRAMTREARLRGSPGWLPLDWRLRLVRLPSEVLLVERPALQPVNVPFLQFGG